MGGSITSSGDVTIVSSTLTSVLGDYRGIQFAGLASVGLRDGDRDGRHDHDRDTCTGSAKSTGGKVGVYAYHNFNGTSFVSANDVQASASVITAALGLRDGLVEPDRDGHDVHAGAARRLGHARGAGRRGRGQVDRRQLRLVVR